MKTVKQIADELNVPKQKVYRYIKRECISEAHQINGVMYYDDAAESLVKQGLLTFTASAEAHHEVLHDAPLDAVIDMLRKELEIKNEQIRNLNDRLAESTAALVSAQQTARDAQALHAGTIQHQLNSSSELDQKPMVQDHNHTFKKRGLFSRTFGK